MSSTTFNSIVSACVDCLESGNKIMIMGVGGNAANASHFAGELAGKYEAWEDPLAVLCINDNMSIVTAITNDFGWEHVFSRQIIALGKFGDVLIAFSISGAADYLSRAANAAIERGLITILLNGVEDFPGKDQWNHVLAFGSKSTPRVQEWQLRMIHDLSETIKSQVANTVKA